MNLTYKKFSQELFRLCDLRDSRPEDAEFFQTQIDNLCIEYGSRPDAPKYKRFPIADAGGADDALGQLTGER